MNKMRCKKGDSSNTFKLTVEGITDYTDYRGELAVLNPSDNSVLIGKLVVSPNLADGFTVAFAPVQTASLVVGDYTVVFEVIKEVATVVEFRRELTWPLQITESLLNN
jgi:hypothetical protein